MNPPTPVKAVFDCNVFLQGLANPLGPAGQCLQAVWDGRVQLFVDQKVIDELTGVVNRPATSRKFRTLSARLPRLLEQLQTLAVNLDEVPERFSLSRDPDDAHYVDLAIASGALLVVTRDKDLLDLTREESVEGRALHNSYPDFRILTPPQFLATLPTTPPAAP